MQINDYLTVPYVDGGRDISVGLDCWGLARHACHHVFNLPLFESFGCVNRHQGDAMHEGYSESKNAFKECQPKAGSLACCFIRQGEYLIFHHVGVCVSATEVLHTGSGHGVKVVPVRAFKRLAMVIKFYEYTGE